MNFYKNSNLILYEHVQSVHTVEKISFFFVEIQNVPIFYIYVDGYCTWTAFQFEASTHCASIEAIMINW